MDCILYVLCNWSNWNAREWRRNKKVLIFILWIFRIQKFESIFTWFFVLQCCLFPLMFCLYQHEHCFVNDICGLEHRDKREIILKSQRYRTELSFVCCVIATCIAIYSIIFYFSVIFPDMCWCFFFIWYFLHAARFVLLV